MKFINALILPAVYTQITLKDQEPEKAFEDFMEELARIEEENPTGDIDFFKATVDYPTHNPADFEGDDLINLSENLSNPRNVEMRNPETGEENSENKCGWYNCAEMGSMNYADFHVDQAIDGKRLRKKDRPYGTFFSWRELRQNSSFVADIANNPTVGFVKVWPPVSYRYEYYLNIIKYAQFDTMRVFVNDIECFAIDRYNRQWMTDMIAENPYDYQAAIFNCEEPVENAYTIRAHQRDTWITFNEIEIYSPLKLVQVPVDQAGSLSVLGHMNKKLALEDIVGHGCHCSKYSHNELVGGYAIDEMDKMCREWNNKLRCLTLPEGACENGIDFEFFNLQVNIDGTPNEDLELACAATQNACENAVCKVTYDWVMKLWESVEANGSGSKEYNYKPDSICYPGPPKQDRKVCVGEAPDVVVYTNQEP